LEKLVEQLLDYNMLLQQTQVELTFFKTDSLIENFVRDNQLALQQHHYQLKIDVGIEQLYADKVLFRRLLDNLLSNAIPHGTPGSIIYIRLFLHGGRQVLEFANQGRAISEENRDIYFKPFQRGSRPRHDRVSGSGLGLSIISECATLMQGGACFIDDAHSDVCVQVTIDLPQDTV
jgi:two-component system sensor histidine kinase GlrK